MEIKKLIEYRNWADNIFFDYTSGLSEEERNQRIPGYNGTVNKILRHMHIVCWSWYTFITDQNFENEPDWDGLSYEDLVRELRAYNTKFLDYLDNYDINQEFDIQMDDKGRQAQSTAENILFNFVTHSAYHRGQLAIFLRFLGVEQIKETDFNPYIYEINQ